MCLTPCTVATEFSIFRATSVSSCDGEAPGSEAVTMTVGRSMSGKFWIFIDLKLIRPTSVSMMNNSIDGIGLRMHQAETFIAIPYLLVVVTVALAVFTAAFAGVASATRTVSPSARKPPPEATTRADPSMPPVISTRSPTRRSDTHLGLGHLRIGTHPHHVAEALAQQHRALRQREALARTDLEIAAREHAGLGVAVARHVDVDDAVARLVVHRWRDMRTLPGM